DIMEHLHLDSSLRQHTAISLLCCFDDTDKLALLAEKAGEFFDVEMLRGLRLITIRHYTEAEIERFTEGQQIILSQKTKDTAQFLIAEN
ncbi:MAG: aspartate kinase, partial [Ferruginibacter sp.]